MKLFTKPKKKVVTFLQKPMEIRTVKPDKNYSFNQVFNAKNHPLYDYRNNDRPANS